MTHDAKFVRGLFYNPPHPKAPSYVKCTITLKRDALIGWLNQQDEDDKGNIKIDILESKGGKIYAKLNEWKPGAGQSDAPRRNDRSPIPQAQAQRIAEEFGGEVVDESQDIPF